MSQGIEYLPRSHGIVEHQFKRSCSPKKQNLFSKVLISLPKWLACKPTNLHLND